MKNKSFNNLTTAIILFAFLIAVTSFAKANSISTSDEIAKAKKEGKAVFLVVTGNGVKDYSSAEKIAKDASLKKTKSVVIVLNKDDKANTEIVTKLGITGVSVPFLLVISPKGVPTAGYAPEQATAILLVNAVPSPKQDEALLALNEKRPVYIVVSKKSFKDKSGIISNCKSAVSKVSSKPSVIEIYFDDASEKNFLTQIGVTEISDKSIVVVANGKGQITETFKTAPTVEQLTTAANKVIKSGGCCPGGSSSGCGKK